MASSENKKKHLLAAQYGLCVAAVQAKHQSCSAVLHRFSGELEDLAAGFGCERVQPERLPQVEIHGTGRASLKDYYLGLQ